MFFKKPEVDSTNLYAEPAPIDPANEASSLEVFKAYKDDVRATGNSMSSSYNLNSVYEDHNRKVKELTGDDLPNPFITAPDELEREDHDRLYQDYTTYRGEGGTEMYPSFTSRWIEQEYRKKLETLAEKYPDKRSQILPDQSFISQSYGRRGEALERSREVWDKSGGGALDWAAWAGGSAYGAFHDPVTWLTMPIGFSGVGLGAKGLAMGALKTGAANAAAEAIIQPGIQSEQNRAGLPSGMAEAATAIGGAFLLGGALDLGIRGSFRAIAPQFGFAPITKDGIVVAWRKPGQAAPTLAPDAAPIAPEFDPELMKRVDAGDPEAQAEVLRQINGSSKKTGDTVIPNSLIERAEGGDLEAARGIAETIAKDDPYAAQALYGADADARLAEIPDPLIAPGEHVRVTNQSLRHVVDPENEPMPARVFADPVLPERLPAIEAELAALRAKVADPAAAQKIASLEAEVQMIARFGRDPVASAELLRSNPGMMTADIDPSLPAVRTSVALSKLSDDAFGQVRSGQAPVELAEMVSDYVPDPLMQSRVLADLTAMKPVHEIQAKSRLQELLRSPEYNPVAPVADDGKTRLIDDPYGAEAKAQLQGLEQTFKEEMSSQGMAPSIEEMMLTPEGQTFAASRAAEIDSIIEDMTGIAPKQTTISRFDTIDDLPPTLRAKVRQANAVRFAEQLKRFMGAKSEAEALSIRTELDAAARGEGIEGIADGDTIWIAAFAQNPRAKIAHEIVHALKGTKQLLPEEEAILASAARDVGVFSKEREALYREAYADRANVDAVLSEEAAAHYIEAFVRGDIPASAPVNVKAASIVDRIMDFAGKVKEALGLKGYRAPASDTPVDPARDVVAAILSGEVAKREIASSIDASAAKAAKLEDQAIGQSMFSMRDDLDSLGYFSGALRAARNLTQEKGTPEQMLAMLKKGGAKDAEIEATGLDKFINSRGTGDAAGSGAVNETPSSGDRSSGTSGSAKRMNQITKSEIIKYLEDNKVKVNEARYSDDAPFSVVLPNGKTVHTTDSRANADATARSFAGSRVVEGPPGVVGEPKWSAHSLDPSNPTYRETVLHLPETRVAEIDARLTDLNAEINQLSGNMSRDIPKDNLPRFQELRAEAKALSDERANLKRGNFQSGHFSEPNILGHMMTSMTKHEGKPVYTIDQIQSDWGQKLRDGGVRDEAKIADLDRQISDLENKIRSEPNPLPKQADDLEREVRSLVSGPMTLADAARSTLLPDELRERISEWRLANRESGNRPDIQTLNRLRAERSQMGRMTAGNPLVNTTDQWTNTTLRRAIRQAAEANAEYIAIPSGDTVLSYNPGDTAGMRGFYGATKVRDAATYERLKAEMDLAEAAYNKALNAQKEVQRRNAERTTPNSASELKAARKSVDDTAAAFDALRKDFKAVEDASDRLIDGIVPKNLRKILTKIDKDTPKPQIIETLDSPNKTGLGQGFTLFKLTDKVKQSVMTEGQPLFGIRDTADQNHVMASDKGAGIYLSAKAGKPGYGYTASGEAMLVTVDPARMMVWNSSEHTPEVRRALDAVGAEHGISISGKSGKTAYRTLAEKLGDDKASEAFLNAGIQGHTQTVKGFDNSVVFDPELVKPDPLNAGAAAPEADQPDMAAQLAEFLTPENLGRLSDDLDVNDPAQAMALAERFAPVLKQYGIDVQQAMPLIQRAMAGEDPQAMLPELMAMAPELDDAMVRQGMDAAQGMAGGDAPMFAMRDEGGRIKRGAERRAKVLATDIQQIESDLKAGAVDQREALQRKRASFLNAKSEESGLDDVIKYRSPRGQEDLAIGFLRMHESLGKENAPFADVATLRQDIAKQAIGKMSEVMWELRKGALLGDLKRVKNAKVRTRMENMIREAAGEKTSDHIAAKMAKAWLDTAEWLRQSFNAAGGDIQKLNGWFAPQYHDAELLLGAGRKAWVARMMGDGVLDRARMVKRDGAQMSDAELKEMLEDIWSTITTDGANKRDVTDSFGKGALYKRHAEHRVLHFKDADAFMNYAKEFGRSDPYSMMVGHIQMMARDIAALRRFGANPELVRDRLKQHILLDAKEGRSARSVFDDLSDSISDLKAQLASIVTPAEKAMAKMSEIHTRLDKIVGKPRFNTEREALRTELFKVHEELQLAMATKATTPEQKALTTQISALLDEMDQLSETQPVMDKNPEQRARRIIARADEMWKQFNGTTNVPTDGFMAGAMSAGRNWVSSSVLSFASISSITDQATSLAARAFIGMPVTRQLGSFIKGFTKEDRQFALRAGVGLDQAMNAFAVSTRFMGFANTAHLTGYITDRTHSFSGLAAMTQASKIAFASDFMSWMAELSKKSYGSLPSWTREMMNRHGFTEADFTALKTVTPEMHRGVAVLTRPAVARDLGEDVAERYMRMLLREQAMAVLEPTIQGRTAFISETKPGTIIGEMARSVAMLKSFPTSYTMLVLGRFHDAFVQGKVSNANTVAAAAAIFGVGTMLGAVAMQMKALTKGQDPQPMDNKEFWQRAFMQSGGVGIFGDFIANSTNRFGSGLASTIMGPVPDVAGTVLDATVGNVSQYARDEPTNMGREGVNLLRKMTPGAFVPFYLRSAYERMILDELQQMVDPEAHKVFRRRRQSLKKNSGSDFYWPPGQSSPDRGPNFGSVVSQ